MIYIVHHLSVDGSRRSPLIGEQCLGSREPWISLGDPRANFLDAAQIFRLSPVEVPGVIIP